MNDRIETVDFLERLPNGYLVKKQELIEKLKSRSMMPTPGAAQLGTGMSTETTSENIPVNPGSGNASLQRALNREGA
jgi:hypothetical protein